MLPIMRGHVRRHARRLRDDGGVDVDDLQLQRGELLRHVAQQLAAVDALELGIGVGKVLADVAEAGGAEQRVADRVQQHVGVGMAVEPFLMRDVDAADDELAPGDQRMHVEALADPHARRRQDRLGDREVLGDR